MWAVSHLVWFHTLDWCSMIAFDRLVHYFIVVSVKYFVIILWFVDGIRCSILLRLPFIDEASLLNAKWEGSFSWQLTHFIPLGLYTWKECPSFPLELPKTSPLTLKSPHFSSSSSSPAFSSPALSQSHRIQSDQ